MHKYLIIALGVLVLMTNNYAIGSEEGGGAKEAPESDRLEKLLCAVMQGDCGHVGGVDALVAMISKAKEISPNINKGNCLDVGSGLGNDANFLYRNGFSHMWGLDVDEAAVTYAQKQYPDITFKKGDALKIHQLFKDSFFDFVYLLNVASNIRDKSELFQKLKVICKPDSLIAILDFTIKDASYTGDIKDLNGHTLYPIDVNQLSLFLKEIGWEIKEIIDVTEDYESWYSLILSNFTLKKDLAAAAGFTLEEIGGLETFLNDKIQLIKDKKIGGVLIFAKKT